MSDINETARFFIKAFLFELPPDGGVIGSMAFFHNLFLNREKVEWLGEGALKDKPRNFL